MKSLQKKLIVYVVLPVAIILSSIGIAGYFYIRDGLSVFGGQVMPSKMAKSNLFSTRV